MTSEKPTSRDLELPVGEHDQDLHQATDAGRVEMAADLEKIRDAGRHLLSVIERLLERLEDGTDDHPPRS
jgi:hypothetical protein